MKSRKRGSRPRPRTQKNTRPRTALPRTDPLEAKDKNAQGQGPKTQAQVLSKKKKGLQNFFSGDVKKKSLQKFFQAFSSKNRLLNFFFFQAIYKISTIQKKVLSSSRGLEASRPRPRTSKCVLEAKDVLEDSTSDHKFMKNLSIMQN